MFRIFSKISDGFRSAEEMPNTDQFKDKVVLVTGSSSGIGETTALAFAKLGAKVVITGRDESRVEEVALKCQSVSPESYQPLKYVGDLGVEENLDRLVDLITETHNRLDVLVNNAGKLMDVKEPSLMVSFDTVHNLNLRAVYYLCLKALPLLEQSKGVIVNNSSICGIKPFPGMLSYCVSKAGLNMLTRCLAIDLGPKGIRVNSVNPGQTKTPIFEKYLDLDDRNLEAMWTAVCEKYPLRREGLTEDVANAIIFLASEESSFITGINLKIDGGFLDSPTLAMT